MESWKKKEKIDAYCGLVVAGNVSLCSMRTANPSLARIPVSV
jgi:hypothetical protein